MYVLTVRGSVYEKCSDILCECVTRSYMWLTTYHSTSHTYSHELWAHIYYNNSFPYTTSLDKAHTLERAHIPHGNSTSYITVLFITRTHPRTVSTHSRTVSTCTSLQIQSTWYITVLFIHTLTNCEHTPTNCEHTLTNCEHMYITINPIRMVNHCTLHTHTHELWAHKQIQNFIPYNISLYFSYAYSRKVWAHKYNYTFIPHNISLDSAYTHSRTETTYV